MPDKTGLRHYSWTQSPHRLTALCTLKHTSLQSISVNTKGRQRVKLEELILNEPKLELDVLDLRQSSPLLTQTLKLPSEWLLTFSGVQGKSFSQLTRRPEHISTVLQYFVHLELGTKKTPKHGHTGVGPEEENQVVWSRTTFIQGEAQRTGSLQS